jgi:hypothetical protein
MVGDMERKTTPHEKDQAAIKNRKIFTEQHLISGMPAGVFMFGVFVSLAPMAVARNILIGAVVALVYFAPMLVLHRNDPKALKIWGVCLMESTAAWAAGKRKKIRLIIK